MGLDYDPMVFAKLTGFFFAGASLYVWRDRVRLSLPWAFVLLVGYLLCLPWGQRTLFEMLFFPYALITLAWKLPVSSLPWVHKTDISYGVYIYAYPIQQSVVALFGQQTGAPMGLLFQAVVALLVIVPLAMLSWYWVEKPMLAKKPQRS